MNKIDCLIDEIYQQTNSMFKNILISIIRITTSKNEAI